MSQVLVLSLAENEAIIEHNLSGWIEVGHALMRIRDAEQYRETGFVGFVEYLESKPWGISPSYAYRQIDAAAVAEVISPIGETLPEGQARELAPLMRKAAPEVVRQVYTEVIEETEGRPTARAIRVKVRETLGQANGSRPSPTLHAEVIERLEAFLHVARKWKPELIDRLPQSVCRRQAARVEEAQLILHAIEEAFAPRLDSLPSGKKAVRA